MGPTQQLQFGNSLIVLIEWNRRRYKIYRTTDHTSGKESAIWKISTELIISIPMPEFHLHPSFG